MEGPRAVPEPVETGGSSAKRGRPGGHVEMGRARVRLRRGGAADQRRLALQGNRNRPCCRSRGMGSSKRRAWRRAQPLRVTPPSRRGSPQSLVCGPQNHGPRNPEQTRQAEHLALKLRLNLVVCSAGKALVEARYLVAQSLRRIALRLPGTRAHPVIHSRLPACAEVLSRLPRGGGCRGQGGRRRAHLTVGHGRVLVGSRGDNTC